MEGRPRVVRRPVEPVPPPPAKSIVCHCETAGVRSGRARSPTRLSEKAGQRPCPTPIPVPPAFNRGTGALDGERTMNNALSLRRRLADCGNPEKVRETDRLSTNQLQPKIPPHRFEIHVLNHMIGHRSVNRVSLLAPNLRMRAIRRHSRHLRDTRSQSR